MRSNTMTLRPLTGSIGAEILDLDLREIDDARFVDIRRAFLDHCMLVIRDQHLGATDLLAFTRRWGEVFITPHAASLEGFPEVIAIRNRGKANTTTEYWHTDSVFAPKPPALSILASQVLPPAGGDTMFANQYLAYETLSPGMRAMIDPLIAIHSYASADDPDRGYNDPAGTLKHHDSLPDVEHPLIRVHPETKRKLLYVSGSWIARLKDMTPKESRPLLDFLHEHAARPEFTCRYRWTPGALALLDNRCTQHFAINDYQGYRRVMHRVMFGGERPMGA